MNRTKTQKALLTVVCVVLTIVAPASSLAGSQASSNRQQSAAAQKKDAGGVPAPTLTPEKQALITELFRLTKADQMAQQAASLMLDQLSAEMPSLVGKALEQSDEVKGKSPEEVVRVIEERSQHALDRIKQLMPERLNWNDAIQQILVPIYDKHFTESELRDLVAFYKTPTGQKAIDVIPAVMGEAMQRGTELLGARMMKLVADVIEEEKQRSMKH